MPQPTFWLRSVPLAPQLPPQAERTADNNTPMATARNRFDKIHPSSSATSGHYTPPPKRTLAPLVGDIYRNHTIFP